MTSTLGIKKIQYPNGTDILTLDSSGSLAIGGNVGMGDTTPDRKLHVKSSSNRVALIESTDPNAFSVYKGSGTSDDGQVRFGATGNFAVIYAGGSEGFRMNAEGLVTKSRQCCFMAQPTSLQSNLAVAGSGVNIDLGTERFDVGGDFASNTFTAPVTGKYALHALFYMNAVDSGTTYYEFTIKTSNRNYGLVVYVGAGGSTDHAYATWSSSVIADMDASDTAYLHFYQAGGTQQTDVSTGTYFMGYLLG